MKAGLNVDSVPDDQSVYGQNGYGLIDYDWMTGFGTNAIQSFQTGLGPSAWRWADRHVGNDSSPTLAPAEANAKYGIPGQLSFDDYTDGVPEFTAKELRGVKQDEIRRQAIVDRSGLGWAGRLTSGLIGGAADPVNLGLAVAPEMLLARVGVGLGTEGLSLAARAGRGAMVGAAGNAFGIPATMYFANQEQRQYGIADALMDLTVGAALGAAPSLFHAGASALSGRVRGGRSIGDAITATPDPIAAISRDPQTQLESLSTSLQQMMVGYPVDLQPVVASVHAADTFRHAAELDLPPGLRSTISDVSDHSPTDLGRWFEGSKIAEADGTPQRVFHGTVSDFAEFDTAHLGTKSKAASAREGFFFTDSPAVASSYADNWKSWDDVDTWHDGRVFPAYLSLKNPLVVDMHGEHVQAAGLGTFTEMIQKAKADGHDGVVVKNAIDPGTGEGIPGAKDPSTHYVVFDPNNIRTAIGPRDLSVRNPTTMPATASTRLVDQDNLLGQFQGDVVTPGESRFSTPQENSGTVPSVIKPDDATALQDMNTMLESSPPMKVRAPDEGMGSSTPDTRELDELAKENDDVIEILRQAGKLNEADESRLSLNDQAGKVLKERGKIRDFASQCLLNEAAFGVEKVDG